MDQRKTIEHHPESPRYPYAAYVGEEYFGSYVSFEAAEQALYGSIIQAEQANRKEIRYDKDSRDYAAYLSGEYVGSYRSHLLAEQALDAMIFNFRQAQNGASDPDERQ